MIFARLIPIVICCISAIFLSAQPGSQSPVTRVFKSDSTDIILENLRLHPGKSVKKCPECTYFWVFRSELHHSDYQSIGELVSGRFIQLHSNGAVKWKGEIRKGLKTGEWILWDATGKVIRKETYKNGKPNGSKEQKAAGKKTKEKKERPAKSTKEETEIKKEMNEEETIAPGQKPGSGKSSSKNKPEKKEKKNPGAAKENTEEDQPKK